MNTLPFQADIAAQMQADTDEAIHPQAVFYQTANGYWLAWHNGIAVDPATLRTRDEHIHAMGDCIAVDGQPSRFIEPIARQARTIAAAIAGGEAVPYEHRAAPVRVKTSSQPLTLH